MSSTLTWTWRTFNELSADELYEILALRQAIFIIEQQCIYPDIDYKDKKALHLLGIKDNKLQTYLRLLSENISYPNAVSFGRIATTLSARNQGQGRAAVLEVFAYLKKINNTLPIIISAQLYLKNFYASLGFVPQDEPYDEDGIPHIEMHKESV